MIGPLTGRLVDLCESVRPRLRSRELRDSLSVLSARLAEPRIRVAIGGRMNAGKSTLVNSVLGQRLAATGATETTTLVTWFCHGPQDRVHVHRRDGASALVPAAAGGGVPDDAVLGDHASISHLVVETPNEALRRRHTIVDTPGLDSLSRLDPDSLSAMSGADGVLYLMPHPGESDREAIDAVRTWAGGLRLGAANIVGVLSRIDTLSADPDPWPVAHRVAGDYARELRSALSTVIPVAGLLAETALGADFTEADTRALRRLAAADRFDVEDALLSVGEFRAWPESPCDATERERLLSLLGLHGIRVALALLDEGHLSTSALLTGLAVRSGISEVLEHVDAVFVRGADRLRASSAMAALDQSGWQTADPGDREVLLRLQSSLDQVRLEPAMRQVELATALADVEQGRVRLAEPDLARLTALATGPDDARRLGLPADTAGEAVCDAADAQIARWRALETRPSRLLQRHARTARELCEHIYFAHRAPSDRTRVLGPSA